MTPLAAALTRGARPRAARGRQGTGPRAAADPPPTAHRPQTAPEGTHRGEHPFPAPPRRPVQTCMAGPLDDSACTRDQGLQGSVSMVNRIHMPCSQATDGIQGEHRWHEGKAFELRMLQRNPLLASVCRHPVGDALCGLHMPKSKSNGILVMLVTRRVLPEINVTYTSGPQCCLQYGLIQQGIDQRRFAHIGPTNKGHSEKVCERTSLV